MILSGKEIVKQKDAGNIVLAPFFPEQLNPNSYNYRIGDQYKLVGDENLHSIPETGLLLQPNTLYLCSTHETIGSNSYVASLIGRSSVGRLGLFIQCHSDMGNLGNAHKWTLEICCVQPVLIYPGMIIGQVSFWQPAGDIDQLYTGRYTQYNVPKEFIS